MGRGKQDVSREGGAIKLSAGGSGKQDVSGWGGTIGLSVEREGQTGCQ